MARKGILSTETGTKPETSPKEQPRLMPRGAVGALQSSLTKLQENAVQEIDPGLIDDAGFEDRLGTEAEADRQLVTSLRTYGQQVPVLLRPHVSRPGRYEIVYGRRRLRALRELGLPVKAMIRQLDDHALVMAQGQENTSRQDLSFIEKASFAAQLLAAGYERQTIADALSIDLPMVSRMLKVGTAFDMAFLRAVGSAPGIGRDRWMTLARLFEDPAARARAQKVASRTTLAGLDSDARFDAVLAAAEARRAEKPRSPAPARPRVLRGADGTVLGDIRRTAKGLTLTVPTRTAEGFAAWLDDHAEALLNDLHDRWQKDRSED